MIKSGRYHNPMSRNTLGTLFTVTTFGESHGPKFEDPGPLEA